MKIMQKTIWIQSLIIGISLIILSLNLSCDKGEAGYLLTTNFIYKNLTTENLNIILLDEDGNTSNNYLIEPQEITISLIQEGEKTGVGMSFIWF